MVKEHRHPIPAWTSGRVIFAGEGPQYSGLGGYGLVVVVQDEHIHIYAHLDSIDAKRGEIVKRGDIVGRQGSTGVSTGSHLHYEIRERSVPSYGWGTDINPGDYLSGLRYPVPHYLGIQRRIVPVFRGRPLPFDGYLIDGTAYIPVRWFAEELGREVRWSEDQGGTVFVE